MNRILSTEQSYAADLMSVVEVYIKPLREYASQPNAQITFKDLSIIFSDLEVIAQFHQVFLQELTKIIESNGTSTKSIGQLFLELGPFLKLYTSYFNKYEQGITCLAKCLQLPNVKEMINQMNKDPRTKLGLRSYLIMPIQRVPR